MLPRFTGPIEQVPPAYSALKVDGERAYDLARAGEEVVLASRDGDDPFAHPSPRHWAGVRAPADVRRRERSLRTPAPAPRCRGGLEAITLTAHVSKGTYIRSLARDIALALGTVGHVTMLRRTKAGPFDLDARDFAGQTGRTR